jgi:hypothetical protein
LDDIQTVFHERTGRGIELYPPTNMQQYPQLVSEQQHKKRHQSARGVANKAQWLGLFMLIK